MKKLLTLLVTLVAIISASAQVPKFEVAGNQDVGIDSFLGFLPRESPANLTLQGETFPTAINGWMNILRTEGQETGTGKSLAKKRANVDYSWMITATAFRNWNAQLESTQQFGNRHHFGLRVFAKKAGVTFRLQDVSCQVQSYIFDPVLGWKTDGVINISTTLATLNSSRLRLDPGTNGINGDGDDVISATQSSSIASTSCLYGGLGVSIGAYGSASDSNAQKLQNAVDYCVLNKLVLQLTVTVPYTDNGVSKSIAGKKTFTTSDLFSNPGDEDGSMSSDMVHSTLNSDGTVTLGPTTPTNWLFVYQRSYDLLVWEDVGVAYLGNNASFTELFRFNTPGSPQREFYRWKSIRPTSNVASRNVAQRATPKVLPPSDNIAP